MERITFPRIVKEHRGPLGGQGDLLRGQDGRSKQIWPYTQAAQGAHGEPGKGGRGAGKDFLYAMFRSGNQVMPAFISIPKLRFHVLFTSGTETPTFFRRT